MDAPEATTDDVRAELNRLKKDLDVQKEVAALRMEMTLQLSYFKWIAWTAGVCLAVLGFLGFKAWSDLTGSAQKLVDKQITEMSDRYSNLSRGFSLVDSGRSRDSIPYLTPLYEANRYDEPVLRTLLFALDDIKDCQAGLARLKELRQDEARFLRLRDPIIFNTAGTILLGCAGENRQALEEARELFDLTLKRQSVDDLERRYPLYNLFRYYFIQGDVSGAENYLERASSVQEGYPVWDGLKDTPWFKALHRRRPAAEKELEAMWNRVKDQKKRKR